MESESFPQSFDADHAPQNVLALMNSVLPRILEGDDAVHSGLRQQFALARIDEVELSGAGFFVTFRYESAVALVSPMDFAGGDARIVLAGVDTPAGCVVFVKDGILSMFEVYTSGGPWTKSTRVVTVDSIFPIPIPERGHE